MELQKSMWAAFVAACLKPKHVGLKFGSHGHVLTATGWHPDGTPFAFASAPFLGDAVERAYTAALAIVAAHNGQSVNSAPQKGSFMGKLDNLAGRMQRLKVNLEARADNLLERVEATEKRGLAALEGHESVLAATEHDIEAMEDSVAQMTNGAPSGDK